LFQGLWTNDGGLLALAGVEVQEEGVAMLTGRQRVLGTSAKSTLAGAKRALAGAGEVLGEAGLQIVGVMSNSTTSCGLLLPPLERTPGKGH
jgi:hypothetical protein